MAFFKFRIPGMASGSSAEGTPPGTGESLEALRRRARHRLMGAVVLVFVAVVAFPLIFDSQPRPVSVDTPVWVPDRQTTPPLSAGQAVPAAQSPAAPLLAASSAVPVHDSLQTDKEEVLASGPAVPSAAASEPVQESKGAHAAAAKPEPKQESKAAPTEAERARALLEDKSLAAEGRAVVQVGAYTDTEKLREVRRKLEQAGLKTYTQAIEGKDGKRIVRVRIGPFESRQEADKAAARVRKLDLPASVLLL